MDDGKATPGARPAPNRKGTPVASNSFGRKFRITTFGESHGHGIGVVIDGVPPRIKLDLEAIQKELDRRRPGLSPVSSPRKEPDRARIWSGLYEGMTTGAPIMIAILNEDSRPEDYSEIAGIFRPGHADFSYQKKYGIRDPRGGGRASGRETATRVAAGAVAKQILAPLGISIIGHVIRIGGIEVASFDADEIPRNPVFCADKEAAGRMVQAIQDIRAEGDSLGGIVEVRALGVPAGLGDPIYEKIDARIAYAMMSIGAVKGVEIGDGFACTKKMGSENNDAMGPGFLSNHAGGILGGISTGEPIVVRLAVKPTSSIAKPQDTVDVEGRPRKIALSGRHDPCIAPRLVPVAEAMMALVLADYS